MFRQKVQKINNQESTKTLFCLFIMIIFVCLFSYGYLIRDTIVNIVSRQNIENQLSVLSSDIISLESQYIKVKNAVTLESAQNMGFVSVLAPKYVNREVKGPDLSLIYE